MSSCSESVEARKGSGRLLTSVLYSSLPPCQNVLLHHVRRANYQVAIWRNAHVPQGSTTVPNPTEGHGWTVENGVMQPLWTDKDVLPKELVDILEETIQEAEDATDTDNDEIGEGFLLTMMVTRVALKVTVTSLVKW